MLSKTIDRLFPNMNPTAKFYSALTGIGGTIGSMTEIVTWFQATALNIDLNDATQAGFNAMVGTLAALIIGAIWKGIGRLLKVIKARIINWWKKNHYGFKIQTWLLGILRVITYRAKKDITHDQVPETDSKNQDSSKAG